MSKKGDSTRQVSVKMDHLVEKAEELIAQESGIYSLDKGASGINLKENDSNNNGDHKTNKSSVAQDGTSIDESSSSGTSSLQEEPKQQLPSMTFDESILDVSKIIDTFMSNDIDGAIAECEKYERSSLYHSLAKSFIKFIIAIIHLEDNELTSAREQIKKTIALIASKRRSTSLLESVSNVLFWRQYNYNEYTDEEVHAELMVAEVQIVLAFINILGEQSLVSMVKGALRIRSANATYKLCKEIIEHKSNWTSELSKENFRAGYLLGHGLFNLFLSHFPTNILKLLSIVGFTGDYFTAINDLREVAELLKSSIRSRLCQIVCIFYLLYVEYGFGIGGKSASWAESQVSDLLNAYPNGALAQLLAGRLEQIKGHPDTAVNYFLKCLDVNLHWKSLGAACYWDLAWCSARQCSWLIAADYTRQVTRVSHYSPAIMEYQYACFLFMHLDANKDKMDQSEIDSLRQKIDTSMALVPQLRIRYAGKTVPPEKFSVIRSQQYTDGERKNILLPALELYYMWNMFSHCTDYPETHLPFLNLVNDKLQLLEAQKGKCSDGSTFGIDEKCLLLLIKGVILRTLGHPLDSISYFKEILEMTELITRDHYLPPHAAFELGFSHMQAGNICDAKYWLEKARNDYTGFLIESMVHLKVHAALVSIKRFQESGESDHIKMVPNSSSNSTQANGKGKKWKKKILRSTSTGPTSWSSESPNSLPSVANNQEQLLQRHVSVAPEILQFD